MTVRMKAPANCYSIAIAARSYLVVDGHVEADQGDVDALLQSGFSVTSANAPAPEPEPAEESAEEVAAPSRRTKRA